MTFSSDSDRNDRNDRNAGFLTLKLRLLLAPLFPRMHSAHCCASARLCKELRCTAEVHQQMIRWSLCGPSFLCKRLSNSRLRLCAWTICEHSQKSFKGRATASERLNISQGQIMANPISTAESIFTSNMPLLHWVDPWSKSAKTS